MDHFIDTSVLVSWYVKETLTQKTMDFLQKNTHRLYISRLVETEFYSALAMKQRVGELSKEDCNHVSALFQKHLTTQVFEMVYLTDEILSKTIEILMQHKTSLKTLDALHVSTCVVTRTKLVTADQGLAASAKILGIPNLLLS